jgi:hypothetical protein
MPAAANMYPPHPYIFEGHPLGDELDIEVSESRDVPFTGDGTLARHRPETHGGV